MKLSVIKAITSICLLILISCEGPEGTEGPVGPPGPSLTGMLKGFVVLYDEFGDRLSDHSGVTISIDNTTYSATTDSDGKWSITDVETGTYNIQLNKSGYGTYILYGVQFVGGGEYVVNSSNSIMLNGIPSFQVTALNIEVDNNDNPRITGTISNAIDEYRRIRIFVHTTDSVSSNPLYYKYTDIAGVEAMSLTFEDNLNTYDMYNYTDIESGTTIFLVAYASSWNNYPYRDPVSGRYVYPSLNPIPSEVISVVVP